MPPAQQDFYADPAIYDILHTPGTAEEVDALLALCRRFVPRSKRQRATRTLTLLEPACGTGRYLRVLASRGHRAIGFDREGVMVEYAARRLERFGPLASVFQADFETFADHLPPASIDVAFTPINSLRHLQTDRAMLAHFGQVARVLRPGGFYAVGLSITAYGVEEPSEDVWEGARGTCRVRQVVQYLPAPGRHGGGAGGGADARSERVISHMTIFTPRGVREIDSTYSLRAYDLAQWRSLVDRSPLRIEAVVDEQGEDLALAPPGYGVFVLEARAARGL
ncbi:MAG: class I SAM-dependent methyltransferase [Phycisphaeraceae bacterium]|nr:class I SAM-dependent methyltransferase [Phycisphaeraceae bacterium]